MPLKMKDLEARTDVSREAIHFYLREGLLPQPERPKKNVAHYSEEHVARIKLIKRLQEERFLPLGVIKEMLDGAENNAEESSGGLAAFELQVLAMLNGDVPAPDQTLVEVAGVSGLSVAQLEELATAGVIAIKESSGGPVLDFRDAAIAEHWGRVLALGFAEVGYGAGYLERYAHAIEKLCQDEVDFFLTAFGDSLTVEMAGTTTRAIDLTNEIFTRLRTQILMRRLNERVESAQAEQGQIC